MPEPRSLRAGAWTALALAASALIGCRSQPPPASPAPTTPPASVVSSEPPPGLSSPIVTSGSPPTDCLRPPAPSPDDMPPGPYDPVGRWAGCLDRVLAVRNKNPGPDRFARCIALVDICAIGDTRPDCCPQDCVDKFQQQQAAGVSESEAIARSFKEGTCVKGFSPKVAR